MDKDEAKGGGEGKVTEEDIERAGLSAEERAALEDDEADDAEALKEVLADGGGDDDKDDDKGAGDAKDAKDDDAKDDDDKSDDAKGKKGDDAKDDDDDAGKDDKDVKDAGGKDKADEGKKPDAADAGDDDDDDEPVQKMPVYKAPPVEKFDDKMAALKKREEDAEAKFAAGDIELKDLLAEQRAVNDDRSALREAKMKHEISVEQEKQAVETNWHNEVNTFMRQVKKAEKIDYSPANRALNAAFDAQLKALAADDANKDRSARWFLREAHKRVKADLGMAGKPAADDKDLILEQKKKKAVDARKPDLKLVPKNLAGVGDAADDDAGTGGEFAHLDKLDGMDLENAIAALSPAQAERYARAK